MNLLHKKRATAVQRLLPQPWLVVLLMFFTSLCALNAQPLEEYDYIIVANVQSPLVTSQIELQRIFTGRTRELANGEIIFHLGFLYERLRLFPYQVERIWQQRIFSGRASQPILLDSDQAVVDYVRANPGAIGYIKNPDAEKYPTFAPLQLYVWQSSPNQEWEQIQ